MNGNLANARAISRQLLCDNFRSDGASDIVPGVVEDPMGLKVHVKFGGSR